MKLLLPIFHHLPMHSGFRIKNIGVLRNLRQSPPVICKIWKNFEVVASKKIEFHSSSHLCLYLSELFNADQLNSAQIATLEFDLSLLDPFEKNKVFENAFEAELVIKGSQSGTWSSILYDMIADKKPNHRYSPILHSAHTASVSPNWTTFVLLMNFRPDYLKAEKNNQPMRLEVKSPEGTLMHSKFIAIDFNSTTLISFKDELASLGGFCPGMQINFKGGESQFAIFTLFFNERSQATGLEHSLPPPYYVSAVFSPDSRKTFYNNAFADKQNSE